MSYVPRDYLPEPPASSPVHQVAQPRFARAMLAATVGLTCTIAYVMGGGEAAVRAAAADPELTRLLRGMAVLKALLSLAAISLVAWRVAYPSGPRLPAGLIASTGLMAAGSVLIWQVAPIVAGAVLFHTGLILLLVLCWADDSGARNLGAAVARRRRGRGR